MLSEVSARDLSRWQAYSRHRAEKSEESGTGSAATRKRKQNEQRMERAEAAEDRGDAPVAEGEVSRGPDEPPPDVGPTGVEFPPAVLWDPPPPVS